MFRLAYAGNLLALSGIEAIPMDQYTDDIREPVHGRTLTVTYTSVAGFHVTIPKLDATTERYTPLSSRNSCHGTGNDGGYWHFLHSGHRICGRNRSKKLSYQQIKNARKNENTSEFNSLVNRMYGVLL